MRVDAALKEDLRAIGAWQSALGGGGATELAGASPPPKDTHIHTRGPALSVAHCPRMRRVLRAMARAIPPPQDLETRGSRGRLGRPNRGLEVSLDLARQVGLRRLEKPGQVLACGTG